MQSRRNNLSDGRVPIPINRGPAGYLAKPVKNVESEKKKPGATSVINIPDDVKVKPGRKATNVSNIPKVKTMKTGENGMCLSIQKLLSMYENGEKSSNVGKGKEKIADEKKPSRCNMTRIPPMDKTPGKRVSPVASKKAKVSNMETKQSLGRSVEKDRKIPRRKKLIPEGKKSPVESLTEAMIVTTVSHDKKNSYELLATAADVQSNLLIPTMTPEHHNNTSVNILNSFITSYLEKAEDRPLDFLLSGCDDRSVFPVCSKKATDNIPSSEVTFQPPKKSDLIIMLRRQNSEPYSPKDCLLQYADPDKPGSWNLGNHTIQNYYFWEPGPTQQLKPYWEVSLFKSNRSLSVLSSRATSGMLSPTLSNHSAETLQAERFRKAVSETKPSWLREASSIGFDHIQTMSFITLMEKGRVLTREPDIGGESPPEEKPSARRLPRVFSKDDQYKPPGHLLIYVKSSQKKLVTVEASGSHPESVAIKKIHKLTRIRRINSDVTPLSWQKIIVTAAPVILILIGAFAFLLYFLTKCQYVRNLTPPIPGLVRGY